MANEAPLDRPWFKFWPEGVPKHVDYPRIPLYEFVSAAAGKWPDETAFSLGDKKLTYKELDELSSRLAAGLYALGVKPGDTVTLFLTNGLEFIIGYYGILKAGGTVSFKECSMSDAMNA